MNLIAYLKNAVYPHTGTPVIAFFGDSVTHGAFECIQGDTAGCTFDFDAVYHERLRRMLLTVNPWLPVSILNAGVAGDNAPMAVARLERDIMTHKPHICVVNFCLNDLSETVEEYTAALREIFTRLMAADIRPILEKAYPADAARGLFNHDGGLRNDMVIPKPFDPRVVPHVARRVAEAAVKSGVAGIIIDDFDAYEKELTLRLKSC